jgi:ABC-type sugar transport system substrate-binding protein
VLPSCVDVETENSHHSEELGVIMAHSMVRRKVIKAALLTAVLSMSSFAPVGPAWASFRAPSVPRQHAAAQTKIALSLQVVDDYYGTVLASAIKQAKLKGIDLIVGNGSTGTSPTTQIAAIQDLLVQHPQVLVVAPQGTGLAPILKRAAGQGVKLIEIDTKTPNYPTPFIGTQDVQGAQTVGNWLVSHHGTGEVGILLALPGEPTTYARTEPVEQVLTHAGVKWVAASSGDSCEVPQTQANLRTMLLANPNITAVYADCGPSGEAVAQVLSQRASGSKKIICAAFDAEVQQVKDILAGRCDAALAQLPVQLGVHAINWAIKVANGATMPQNVNNGDALVTAQNAKCWYAQGNGYSYPLPCAHVSS